MVPNSWSPDGRFLLYMSIDPQTNADLWVVPMEGDPTPSVFLKTPFREAYGAFSPDGRWVAYHSNESGRPEIYVRPFVPPDAAGTPAAAPRGQWQVSTAGGIMAAWRPDGTALYYLNPAGEMMAAPITVVGDTLEPGAPVVLFPTRIVGGGVDAQQGRQYDVAPDGRFLINTELDADADAAPITLIQNWNPAPRIRDAGKVSPSRLVPWSGRGGASRRVPAERRGKPSARYRPTGTTWPGTTALRTDRSSGTSGRRSEVRNTSNCPSASASSSPFRLLAQPISGTVRASCPVKSPSRRLGRHSSSRIRTGEESVLGLIERRHGLLAADGRKVVQELAQGVTRL